VFEKMKKKKIKLIKIIFGKTVQTIGTPLSDVLAVLA